MNEEGSLPSSDDDRREIVPHKVTCSHFGGVHAFQKAFNGQFRASLNPKCDPLHAFLFFHCPHKPSLSSVLSYLKRTVGKRGPLALEDFFTAFNVGGVCSNPLKGKRGEGAVERFRESLVADGLLSPGTFQWTGPFFQAKDLVRSIVGGEE